MYPTSTIKSNLSLLELIEFELFMDNGVILHLKLTLQRSLPETGPPSWVVCDNKA